MLIGNGRQRWDSILQSFEQISCFASVGDRDVGSKGCVWAVGIIFLWGIGVSALYCSFLQYMTFPAILNHPDDECKTGMNDDADEDVEAAGKHHTTLPANAIPVLQDILFDHTNQ